MQALIFAELREFVAATLPADARAALDAETSGAPGSAERLAASIRAAAGAAGLEPAELERRFGTHLFGRFATLYPVFFVDAGSALSVLAELDGKVHAEVQRLHPEAEFPAFECRRLGPARIELRYRSTRPFAALAEGLIRGCAAYFGERLEVRCLEVADGGTRARFVVGRAPRGARAASRPAR
jgi:hypothetical protein